MHCEIIAPKSNTVIISYSREMIVFMHNIELIYIYVCSAITESSNFTACVSSYLQVFKVTFKILQLLFWRVLTTKFGIVSLAYTSELGPYNYGRPEGLARRRILSPFRTTIRRGRGPHHHVEVAGRWCRTRINFVRFHWVYKQLLHYFKRHLLHLLKYLFRFFCIAS